MVERRCLLIGVVREIIITPIPNKMDIIFMTAYRVQYIIVCRHICILFMRQQCSL